MTNRKTCQNIMPDSFPIFAPISLVGGVPECYSNMLAVAKKKKKKKTHRKDLTGWEGGGRGRGAYAGLSGVGLRWGLDVYTGCMQPETAQGFGCWQGLGLMKMQKALECLQPPSAEDQVWALNWLPRLSGGGCCPGSLTPKDPSPSDSSLPLPHSLSHTPKTQESKGCPEAGMTRPRVSADT